MFLWKFRVLQNYVCGQYVIIFFLSLVVFSRVAVLMKMVLFVLSVKVPLVSGQLNVLG